MRLRAIRVTVRVRLWVWPLPRPVASRRTSRPGPHEQPARVHRKCSQRAREHLVSHRDTRAEYHVWCANVHGLIAAVFVACGDRARASLGAGCRRSSLLGRDPTGANGRSRILTAQTVVETTCTVAPVQVQRRKVCLHPCSLPGGLRELRLCMPFATRNPRHSTYGAKKSVVRREPQ